MKKIINGRMYNTETAELVAEYWNGLPTNNFKYVSEELYRKDAGELFLFGKGGPLTDYAVSVGDNCYGGGERIRPMDIDSVKQWLEDTDNTEAYVELFGEPKE